jgi:hypothetical protein
MAAHIPSLTTEPSRDYDCLFLRFMKEILADRGTETAQAAFLLFFFYIYIQHNAKRSFAFRE